MAGENYRRIVPTFWTDPDVKGPLTFQDKGLLLYFFTSPHSNMIGLYYCPLGYVAAETALPVGTIATAIAGPLAPFVSYDAGTEEIFVRRGAFHQMGELKGEDNRKVAARRLLEGVHSRALKRAFLAEYATWKLGVTVPPESKSSKKPLRGASETPSEGLTKGLNDAAEAPPQAITDTGTASVAETGVPAAHAASNGTGGGWTATWAADYKAKIGKIEPGRIGKRCAEAVEQYGPARARQAWQTYIRTQPHMRFGEVVEDHFDTTGMGPEQFMKNLTVWIKRAETPMPRREIVHAPAPA